jgi:hypothetical protein
MDESGVSQVALSDAAGVKRHWINQVILGKRSLRVNRDSLEALLQPMLKLVAAHNNAADFREHLETLFARQLGYQQKMIENWNTGTAAQVATELLTGLIDDGLTKDQMAEVADFLKALVVATRDIIGGKKG